jgi:hypothetical protein
MVVRFFTTINKWDCAALNIGARSISSPVGLNAPGYQTLMTQAIKKPQALREILWSVDDPFLWTQVEF